MSPQGREAQFFARLSRELMSEPGEPTTVQRVTQRGVEVVEACDWCALSLRRRKHRVETVAASDPIAEACDELQTSAREGPGVEAIGHDEYVVSQDLDRDMRWPSWSPLAVAEGARSVLSVRLSTERNVLGALTFYSARPNAWGPDDVDVALVFAAHAANALNSVRLTEGLRSAMESRHLIGVAQGVLMVRFDLTSEQAFEVLRRISSEHNVKLRSLAAEVVEERSLPGRFSSGGRPSGEEPVSI